MPAESVKKLWPLFLALVGFAALLLVFWASGIL